MEQSIVPLIPVQLDKLRHLRLDIAALCNAERDISDFWDKKISVYSVLLEIPVGINDLSILVLHGLRHEDPTLSLGEVKGMLNHSSITVVYQAVNDAWNKSTRSAEQRKGEALSLDPPPPSLTGAPSGLTAVASLDSTTTSSGD